MKIWYNEINDYAARWLINLMEGGLIAPGVVDTRSIQDIKPYELRQYTQCHFFAGIGVWSYALRAAGWSDSRPVWTGSCPCQPFSDAGAGAGFDDERHLWPDWQWIIQNNRPPTIFGEQVASKDAGAWIDLIQTDLEAMGYTTGAVPFPSASVGAPHIRDRLYWVGYASGAGLQGLAGDGHGWGEPGRVGAQPAGPIAEAGGALRVAHPQRGNSAEFEGEWTGPGSAQSAGASSGPKRCRTVPDARPAGPVNGFWADADWLYCRDGKWRPVEPGTFPLADGIAASVGRMQPRLAAMGFSAADIRRILGKRNSTLAIAGRNRVGRLKGYGNAINAEAAKEFIKIAMEYRP